MFDGSQSISNVDALLYTADVLSLAIVDTSLNCNINYVKSRKKNGIIVKFSI